MRGQEARGQPLDGRLLVLYDGACAWCTGWAAWLCRHDRRDRFRLAPLDGATAARFLNGPPPADTMVLVAPAGGGTRLATRSDAVLGVLRALGWPWRGLGLLGTSVPRRLRDGVYDRVARRRHALPGSRAACDPDAVPPARRLP